MNIEKILEVVSGFDKCSEIRFDFAGQIYAPAEIHCWRNFYKLPAISYKVADLCIFPTTVNDFIKELERACDGRRYRGQKGGLFSFTRDLDLRVAPPDINVNMKITGFNVQNDFVTICTILSTKSFWE